MKKTNYVKKQTPFRKICDEKKLNQEELAEMLGVKPRTVYAYLIGERTPSLKTMKIMKKKIGINPLEVFMQEMCGDER